MLRTMLCSRGILFSVSWKAYSRLSDAVAQWRELFVHRPMHLTKLSFSGPILELVDVDLEVYELIRHASKVFFLPGCTDLATPRCSSL